MEEEKKKGMLSVEMEKSAKEYLKYQIQNT